MKVTSDPVVPDVSNSSIEILPQGAESSTTVASVEPVAEVSPAAANGHVEYIDPCVDKAVEQLKNVAGEDTIVHDIPDGEPLFMFSTLVGKTRPLTCFYDSGASHLLLKEGVPQNELDSVQIRKGPIPVSAVGGTEVYMTGEWAVLMEKSDESRQIMIGVTAENLTIDFPKVPLDEALKDNEHERQPANIRHADQTPRCEK